MATPGPALLWRYRQRTGELLHGDVLFARGYAGRGEGKNNPAMQGVRATGPIPQGSYQIVGPPHAGGHMGPDVLYLAPAPDNVMFGRGGFFIHSDSIHAPGTASEGCIVIDPPRLRWAIWDSGDHYLLVESGDEPEPPAAGAAKEPTA
ncbi:MAG TPA: tlde1 domain-containing protein [Anaeromyxobacteraceae bacterium]|nr:tlde1 domain-containing protein [Anaeromyxobacteraceae bacterium]